MNGKDQYMNGKRPPQFYDFRETLKKRDKLLNKKRDKLKTKREIRRQRYEFNCISWSKSY